MIILLGLQDYGVNKQVSKKKDHDNSKSKLPPQVIELMKMLFDVETYRHEWAFFFVCHIGLIYDNGGLKYYFYFPQDCDDGV